jgi:predicted phage tail protein
MPSIRARKETSMHDKIIRPSRTLVLLLGLALCVGFLSTSAVAKPAPVTKITFKLSDHNVPPGAAVTGSVLVRTRSNHEWVPFVGAPLSVRVDGTEVLTLVTDAEGRATVSYVALEGGHVMRVVFVGDATHKRARRAQGFAVVAGATAVPAAPVLTAITGAAVVNLSWTVPFDGGSAITGYNIYRGTTSGGETLLTAVAPGTVFADFGVTGGITYFYRVSAVNADGEGAFSNEAFATPS